ncbi:MAG: transcriptional regulator [Actinomycetota bacterium]|nr:transcriptional regulator [Actinomycetota bacterium]
MASTGELSDYVEEIARYFSDQGLPLIAGRILGWLLVCDPAEQSTATIGEGIRASKASLSTNLRLLRQLGLVDRVTRPGERTVYYSLDVELWYERTRRALSTLTDFRDLLAEGVELLGANERRAQRLVEVHDLYTEMEQDLQGLWERWDLRRKQR